MEAYRRSVLRGILVPSVVAAFGIGAGCAGPRSGDPPGPADRLPPPAESRTQEGGDAAAIVDGRTIAWRELVPALADAAGGAALEDAALDALVNRELGARGLAITPADIDRERAALVDSMSRGVRVDENEAARLVAEVRRARNLGDARFRALLARTAGLRALVAGTVSVSDEEVRQAHAIRHGPTLRVRVIVVPSEREAAEILGGLRPEDDGLSVRFARAAVEHSRDSTGPRGGEIGVLSPSDPTYPAAVRGALDALAPGRLTGVVAVDRGFMIGLLEERRPGDDVPLESSADALRAELSRRRERVAMDDLARRLLAGASIVVPDPVLAESWRRHRSAASGPGQRP